MSGGIAVAENRRKDEIVWKNEFGRMLKTIMELYELDYREFCEEYHVSEATFRYWKTGAKLPQIQYISEMKKFFYDNIPVNPQKTQCIQIFVQDFLCSQNLENKYYELKNKYPECNTFVGGILEYYHNIAKHKLSTNDFIGVDAASTGRTQAIVFDFDGTLTKDKINRTTWEKIWIELGYSEKECQELHRRFNKKEINHSEWCKITENKFKECNLHKQTLEDIAGKIKLIKGVRKTLKQLSHDGIKIYVVSGSIGIIIKNILGDMTQYIDEIKANYFKFNSAGYLVEIVGTQYDFEGKAYFIQQIASELKISPKDILFVGNSNNDRFAYLSGARTLCINPILTDPANDTIWHNYIQTCEDLSQILSYL